MKSKKVKVNKLFKSKEKRLEKKYVRLIYIFGFASALYYYLIEPTTIGHDNRYMIYVFMLPTILGMIVLGIYRRDFLINRFTENKGFVLWTFMIFFYLLQGFMFSFISFGQVAKVTWDYVNYLETKKNSLEILHCDIKNFNTGKNSKIYFIFQNHNESLKVNNSDIKIYKDETPANYSIKIYGVKGIWNYYTVKDWVVEHK